MTDKPTRTTSKKQIWFALFIGGAGFLAAGVAAIKGVDGQALEALIWASFALIACSTGIYQGTGAVDHFISKRGEK